MTSRTLSMSLVPLASIALCASLAFAQQAPAPPAANAPSASPAPVERQAPPPQMRGGMMRPGMMQRGPGGPGGSFRGGPMSGRGNMHGGFHGEQGGFHIGPTGMWWRNPMVVQRLSLTADQTRKMDDIFEKSRLDLIDKKAAVEKAQVMLEPLLSANPLDTAKAQAQIDAVANARAELEKTNAHMLLGIRAVLTPDQWTKLRTHGQGPAGQSASAQAGPGGPAPGQGRSRGLRPGGSSGPNAPAPQQ